MPAAGGDKIACVILRGQPGVQTAGPEQYFETTPDGRMLQLWETTPPEFRARYGPRVLLSKWPTQEVCYLLTDKEAEILWEGDAFSTSFPAGALMRILLLKDGTRIDVRADQFLQTDRNRTLVQLWQLKPGAPPVREQYWYVVPSDDIDLIGQWSVDAMCLAVSDYVIRNARQHGLLPALTS